jgi:predicted aspartyl protease
VSARGPFPYLEPEEDEEYPAPGCTVKVSWDRYSRDYTAIIDSGAAYTCVPVELVSDFQLEQRGEIDVVGTTGPSEVQGIYEINLEFLGLTFSCHPVLAGTGEITKEFILIGRDILNSYSVLLDGPNLIFTIE